MRRRLCVLLLSIAALLGPGALPAQAEGGDNAAVAVNLRDGADVFRFAFNIRRELGDVVDESNAAVAFASCDECRTIALAIQVVLVMSDADTVTPENVAIAINYECTSCETFAAAYQFVLSTGGQVRFTADGTRELNELRRELRELIQQDLPFDQLAARIDELMDRLRQVLANELVPIGTNAHDGAAPEEPDEEQDETTPTETTPTESTETDTTETDTTETDTTETTTTGESTP